MKVVLASKNRHKWEEIRKITEKFDMELVMESDLGVDIDVEETGTTFEENSFLKANAVMRATGLPALADDAEVTVVGSHTANLAFHPMAFAYVTRPLANPDGQGVMSYVTSFNGISLRVTKGYDQQYKRSTYSMDVLYGFKTVYPELAVRALG